MATLKQMRAKADQATEKRDHFQQRAEDALAQSDMPMYRWCAQQAKEHDAQVRALEAGIQIALA